jgi:hypothetical protein
MAKQIFRSVKKYTLSIVMTTLISSLCLGQSSELTSGSASRSVLDFYLGISINSVSGSEVDYLEQQNKTNGRGPLEKSGVVGVEAGVNYLHGLGRISHMRTGLQLTHRQLSIPVLAHGCIKLGMEEAISNKQLVGLMLVSGMLEIKPDYLMERVLNITELLTGVVEIKT